DVARRGVGPADDVGDGEAIEVDAVLRVPERQGAGDVRADEVPLDEVARRGGAGEVVDDLDAVQAVVRDQVAGAGGGPADDVREAGEEHDARAEVAETDLAGRVGPHTVA